MQPFWDELAVDLGWNNTNKTRAQASSRCLRKAVQKPEVNPPPAAAARGVCGGLSVCLSIPAGRRAPHRTDGFCLVGEDGVGFSEARTGSVSLDSLWKCMGVSAGSECPDPQHT